MQSKKFLSTLLVFVLICTCAVGMLITDAGAREEKVSVEFNTDLATTIAGIDGSAFTETQYAEIVISGEHTVSVDENGVLFGVPTVFDSTGARLPITITVAEGDAASLVLADGVTGDISCSNSYTFKNVGFYLADAAERVNFYAGSGEVELDTVVLSADGTGKNAWLFADNASSAAFAGWGADQIAVAKGEGTLIPTSLTLKNTDYTQAEWASGGTTAANCVGQIGIVGATADFSAAGDAVKANMISATLVVEDCELAGVRLRHHKAASPVAEANFVMNDTSETGIDNTKLGGIVGIGVGTINSAGANKESGDLPPFNANFTVNGGTVSGRVMFFRGASFTGNLTVNINGGEFKDSVFTAYDSAINGTVVANVTGGNIVGTLYGPNSGEGSVAADENITEESQIRNFVNISGGTIAAYQGNRVVGSVITTVSDDADITTYYGSYATDGGGGEYDLIVNNINGGTIKNYFGSGRASSNDPAGYTILKLVNNFNGGTVTGTTYCAGLPKSVIDVENNFSGTVFDGDVYGTYYYTTTVDGKPTYNGTEVTGTLTNNLNPNQNAGATSAQFKGSKNIYFVGGPMSGDVVVNFGKEGGTPASTTDSAYTKVNSAPNSNCKVAGDVTVNLNCVYNFEGEMTFWTTRVGGDYNFNIFNMYSHTSNFYPMKAYVDGDVNIYMENAGFNRTSSSTRTLQLTDRSAGRNLNVHLKNVKIGTGEVFKIGSGQSGDVHFIFEDVTMNWDYKGIDRSVAGTFTNEWRGTNTFKNGYVTHVAEYTDSEGETFPVKIGCLENILNVTNFTADFVGNTLTVPKVINRITGGKISGNFYGTGAPVGTTVPAAEEGGEATFVPGDVENYISGGTISGIFFGTGLDTVANVTTTMTAGTISANSAATSSQLATNGCYYGNMGDVTGAVTNNIFGGKIGNNYHGSMGNLTGGVINNFGNNLYAELYPEAEALSKPSLGRANFIGGKYSGTAYDGSSVATEYGTAKFLRVVADNVGIGQTYGAPADITGVDPETGCAIYWDLNNVKNTSNTYVANNTAVIAGNVVVKAKNTILGSNTDYNGLRSFNGVCNVSGTVTYDIENCDIGIISHICSDSASTTGLNVRMVNTEIMGSIFDLRDDTSSNNLNGSVHEYFENCTFGTLHNDEYVKSSVNYVASIASQLMNRNATGESTITINGGTIYGSLTLGMQGRAGHSYYVYGDVTLGDDTRDATLYTSRQSNTKAHVGAKLADGVVIPAETSIHVHENSMLIASREYGSTTTVYDVSLTGTGLIVPTQDKDLLLETPEAEQEEGWQYHEATAAKFLLAGNLSMGAVSPAVYLNASDENGGTVSAIGGKWEEGKVYVTALGSADITKLAGRNVGAADGYAKRVNNTLVGAKFAGSTAVNLDVEERIVLKLWVLKDDVDAYVNSGMQNTDGEVAFRYWGSIALDEGEEYLCEGAVTPENLAEIPTSADGLYYKLTIGAVAANNFDKEIELATSAVALNQLAADTPITILNIADAGINDPNNASNTLALNLFKAIYNYGASVLDVEMIAMPDFVQTGAAAPVYQKGSAEDIQFTSMNLLMGDAIGIRFNGSVIDYGTTVTLKVNGEPAEHYYYDVESGTVDIYVNLENVNDVYTFIIYTNGAPAIAVKTSIKGYTEAVMNNGAAELAVAQLAQACADILA